jgi:hypothetical protein
MYNIGIAKKIVKISEYFLVSTNEKYSKEVLFTGFELMNR